MDHDTAAQDNNDDANFFESNLLAQIISVVGWVILTMSIIVLCWVGEPCMTRITSRWRQPPRCVVERGNATALLSRLLASTDDKDGEYIILPTVQRERLINLERSFVDKAPLTPVIFHGPSGTGKCLAAKQLSKALALPYALVSGRTLAARSSFQIDALVSWANAYSRGNGILIYIDQADAFLSKDSRLSKFIGILDGVRRDIIFILATQNVENIDRAVLDRCEQLQFSLPDAECRRDLLLKYFDEHVSSINENNEYASSWLSRFIRTLAVKDQRMQSIDNGVMVMNGESLENSVALTRGLSGRDICELMMSLKTKLRRPKHGRVTYLDVWEAIDEAQIMKQGTAEAEHSISMTNLQDEVDFHEVTVV